jgi:hypothetical protein
MTFVKFTAGQTGNGSSMDIFKFVVIERFTLFFMHRDGGRLFSWFGGVLVKTADKDCPVAGPPGIHILLFILSKSIAIIFCTYRQLD